MPTIDDPAAPPRSPAVPGGRHPGRLASGQLLRWPLVAVLLLVVLAAWRVGSDPERAARPTASAPTATRSGGAAEVDVPRDWIALERGPDHATWGVADRSHTVTLASTEASALPLPTVVEELVAQSARQLPGTELLERPRPIDVDGPHAHGDTAMLVRFRATAADGGRHLVVEQVWRRDTRSGFDVVATWTSADGRWPVSPRDAIPRAAGSR